MWVVLEPFRGHIAKMRVLCAAFFVLAGLVPAMAGGVRVSPWAEFREARVRLILVEPAPGDSTIRGGIGIRLMPDYKTYWRNPGDSGVPPVFDFSASKGAAEFDVRFPMPTRFDDGAGGQAWGYKSDVILPFVAKRIGQGPVSLALKLDFAVCGTMCIPLAAQLQLEGGQSAGLEVLEAVARAESRVPKRLAPADLAARVQVVKREAGERPIFTLEIRHEASPEDFALFTESRGYLHIKTPIPVASGRYQVVLKGQPPSGSDKGFGPVRLTFGSKKEPYDGLLDLDGNGASP